MGHLEIAFVLEWLAELEHQLAAMRVLSEEIVARPGDARARAAVGRLYASVALTSTKIELLRERVLEQITAPTLATRELGLAARTNVIAMHLTALRVSMVPPDYFIGRFKMLADVQAFVLDQIGRINANWLRERKRLVAQDAGDGSESAREALVRVALGNAEIAFALIGRAPDLAHFLRHGARSHLPVVRTACRVIAAVVDARLPRGAPDGGPGR